MLVNTIIFICTLVPVGLVGWFSYRHGERSGERSAQETSYHKGRGDGWYACENLIVERMMQSENMDLTKREILDEFIQ